jgi:hypothetical protein
MRRNPEYVDQIRKIAEVIYEQYRLFRDTASDPCESCLGFTLPAASTVARWQPPFVNR